jgi:hypothetical protein
MATKATNGLLIPRSRAPIMILSLTLVEPVRPMRLAAAGFSQLVEYNL